MDKTQRGTPAQRPVLSNILFTNQGFKNQHRGEESVNMIFFSGFDRKHPLRLFFPEFDLSKWDSNCFVTPKIDHVKISGSGVHKRQYVLVKLIYNRTSEIDSGSFDAIPTVFIDFERELPAEVSVSIRPEIIIEGACWEVARLRSYASPNTLNQIIVYDFSFL